VIARLSGEWQAEYEHWQGRDLSARRYVYLWADGVYLQARMEEHAECMLVMIGATPEGGKELVGFQVGVRESTQSWRELLVEVKRRGLTIAPEIAVGDGALGFWKALDEIYPRTRHQRCWLHKTANVLNKVPRAVQATMKVALREIHGAETRSAPEAAMRPSPRSMGRSMPGQSSASRRTATPCWSSRLGRLNLEKRLRARDAGALAPDNGRRLSRESDRFGPGA